MIPAENFVISRVLADADGDGVELRSLLSHGQLVALLGRFHTTNRLPSILLPHSSLFGRPSVLHQDHERTHNVQVLHCCVGTFVPLPIPCIRQSLTRLSLTPASFALSRYLSCSPAPLRSESPTFVLSSRPKQTAKQQLQSEHLPPKRSRTVVLVLVSLCTAGAEVPRVLALVALHLSVQPSKFLRIVVSPFVSTSSCLGHTRPFVPEFIPMLANQNRVVVKTN